MTRKGFKQFLASNPQATFKAKTPFYCPLAAYTQAQHPTAVDVSITSTYLEYEVRGRRYGHELPQWAQTFVRRVDDLKHGHEPEVTAAEALNVLERAA